MHEIFLNNDVARALKAGSQNLLSTQESIVAAYLMSGYRTDKLATVLCRSRNTIKRHVSNIKIKCDCDTHIELGSVLHSFLKNGP